MLPVITHLLLSLPNPDAKTMQDINNMFYDFLWHGRTKIKQTVIIKQYFEGGLRMINLYAFVDALKITWIRRVLQKENNWQLIMKNEVSVEKLFNCGSEYIKEVLPKIKNMFWKDVFKALLKLENILDSDMNEEKGQEIPIFHNKYLYIDGKSFFYKTWFKKGIRFVSDLINENGMFYDWQTFGKLLPN